MVRCTLVVDGTSQVCNVFHNFNYIPTNDYTRSCLVVTHQNNLGLLAAD